MHLPNQVGVLISPKRLQKYDNATDRPYAITLAAHAWMLRCMNLLSDQEIAVIQQNLKDADEILSTFDEQLVQAIAEAEDDEEE